MPAGNPVSTERAPRVLAARKLLRRAGREQAGRFLAEGAQAVEAAVAAAADGGSRTRVHEIFISEARAQRYHRLRVAAEEAGIPVWTVTDRAAASLSETVTPQGLVAVCALPEVTLEEALAGSPRLVVVLVEAADPGNVGTVIRVADAAGADAMVLAGDVVDPYNGKCVRGSAGSVFHLPLARVRDVTAVLASCRRVGLWLLAATASGELDLDDADTILAEPSAWLFGNETHGLPAEVAAVADHRIAIPIHGRAESLNLATAAAVCVYATARAQRRCPGPTVTLG
ncbi:MAG: RNA methyltransferase [Pseudonocardia sp.]|nr:RNA methyltransferase [Pseudonocardia sp.]